MKAEFISLLVLITLGFAIVSSGCLGGLTDDGPPSQYNVTFEEPTTGTVFSNLSYSSKQHNSLNYNVENTPINGPVDRLEVYWKKGGDYELFYHRNITKYSEYIDFYIGAPIDQSDPPERYQIRAWNETAGVLDKINVTIRNEGGGGLFP